MQILTSDQFSRKVKRMAHEIAESYLDIKDLYIGGISPSGRSMARWLGEEVQCLTAIQIHSFQVNLTQDEHGVTRASYDVDVNDMRGQHVVIVDDVSNTGSSLFYACSPLMHIGPYSLRCAVMVDRTHKAFPIHPSYVGLQLATTLREHITVICKDDARQEASAHLE